MTSLVSWLAVLTLLMLTYTLYKLCRSVISDRMSELNSIPHQCRYEEFSLTDDDEADAALQTVPSDEDEVTDTMDFVLI